MVKEENNPLIRITLCDGEQKQFREASQSPLSYNGCTLKNRKSIRGVRMEILWWTIRVDASPFDVPAGHGES